MLDENKYDKTESCLKDNDYKTGNFQRMRNETNVFKKKLIHIADSAQKSKKFRVFFGDSSSSLLCLLLYSFVLTHPFIVFNPLDLLIRVYTIER